MERKEKAILVVSFGCSTPSIREVTISQIEEDIKQVYKDYKVYTAFTSRRIRLKIYKQEQVVIQSVPQALETMIAQGIKEIVIQPTFIIKGVQYDEMKREAEKYRQAFTRMTFANPLLTSIRDYKEVIKLLTTAYPSLQKDEVVLCMGHGADEYLSVSFAALDYMFKEEGYENYYVGTIRSYPGITHVLKQLKKKSYHKIWIQPLMVVAGYHAQQDILGKAEEAWKQLLEKEGYEVRCCFKGLGEYKAIRQLYIEHIKEAI